MAKLYITLSFSLFLLFFFIFMGITYYLYDILDYSSYTICGSAQNTIIGVGIDYSRYLNRIDYFLKNDYFFLNYNSSDMDLERELGSYEWHNILRSEIDNLTSISVDLAVRYGNEYMGGLVNDKLNNSRQVYYRGMEQELSFQIPFSGLKNQLDFNLNFNFDGELSLNSWDFMKKEDSVESYFEYSIKGIDVDVNDQVFYENPTDYYGLDLKIKYNFLYSF